MLVTGAAGFLGSHLVDRLLAEGHTVLGMDNFITGNPGNVEHLKSERRFRLVRQDVSQPYRVSGPLDGVFHLASPASPLDYQRWPVETLMVGSYATHRALVLARAKGGRFFLASTSEVYGDPLVHPQHEGYWGNVNPVGPRAMYDEAKRFAEALTTSLRRAHGADIRIARIFNTYGPRMRPRDGRVVSNFIVQALSGEPITIYGDGSQTRSFCYVSDLIEGLYRLFQGDRSEPTNLGNPNEFTVQELAETVKEMTGSASPIEHRPLPQDDPRVRQPDISAAKAALDWVPKVSLRDGLTATIEYFRQVVRR
ncbi:MAG TPA: UDP-glucuronic acid decarboxylase family protein [Gemmatimonadales bacterium]|nr:UDP-glucuronic acid decarboxylase family protein [Gemmatimonadales bacterium]